MSDSSDEPWSNNPNAPQITYEVHLAEKENFSGTFIEAILYGIVIVLFFQCMNALLDPINRRTGSNKLGLILHTAAMFVIVTINHATNLHPQSASFIDNRDFPPGPIVYLLSTSTTGISVVSNVAFSLNQWLADGLLLYRCYNIYAANYWIIAFPCLMYLATVATGIILLYQTAQPTSSGTPDTLGVNIGLSYYSISSSLNVLLTLMIITRLIMHSKDFREAMGTLAHPDRLYNAVVTMLIESSAIYAAAVLLFIVPWGIKSSVQFIFFPILIDAQVIGPFLIVLRVANQRALTSETIVSGHLGSLRFIGEEQSTDGGILPDGDPIESIGQNGGSSGRPGSEAEAIIK